MRINIETQEKVIFDYKSNILTLKDIAKNNNISFNTAKKILLVNNIKLKDFKINDEIKKNIIDDYICGINNKDISKKYNVHRSTVQSILLNNNIELRKQNETSRKHKLLNEHFFNNINTEEKAYILGLLYADGNVRHNGFELTLMEDDKELLNKISKIFYNKNILYYRKSRNNSKPQYRLFVTSNIIKNDLVGHGCMSSKTFKIRLPTLNENMYRHFIRGYYDGDGCISFRKSSNKLVTITITSNNQFCNDISTYINNNLNINIKSRIRYGDVGDIILSKQEDIIFFLNWIYYDANLYLMRKYLKYKNYLITIKKHKNGK